MREGIGITSMSLIGHRENEPLTEIVRGSIPELNVS